MKKEMEQLRAKAKLYATGCREHAEALLQHATKGATGELRDHMSHAAAEVIAAADRLEAARGLQQHDDGINALFVRCVELRSLFVEHADELGRALWVASRVSRLLLGKDEGEPVARFFENLETAAA